MPRTESRRRSCSTSWKKDPGPASSRRSSLPPKAATRQRACSSNWNSPTRRRKATGSTAGMVGVLGYGGGVIGRYSDVAAEVPERRSLPHHAREPSRGMVLHQRCAAHDLRHLGAARLGPDQHARLDRRHHPAGHHHRPTRAHVPGTGAERLRPRRLRLGHAHALLLRRHGALRVGLLRHHEALLRPDHGVPGRTAPAGVPLQVQDQVRGLPQRLRRLDRARRPVRHRHLEGRDPGGRCGGGELRRRGRRHPERGLRPLSHEDAWAGTARSSPSTNATACTACTASTCCPRRCGPARSAAR